MSMLVGMISPSSGTALVNGKDIRKDINAVRASIGLCPQHNILFDDLTVREHISFFSRLKGLHHSEVDREVDKYVKLLKLENKIDARAGSLSGGMTRKLSCLTSPRVALILRHDAHYGICSNKKRLDEQFCW
jgi:ATP-binding cassette, subfamily A (ABC1), member 3